MLSDLTGNTQWPRNVLARRRPGHHPSQYDTNNSPGNMLKTPAYLEHFAS